MTAWPVSPPARPQRTHGAVRVAFQADGDVTRLATLYQEGAGKVRFPRTEPGAAPEAVIVNLGGGLTGGDRFTVDVALGAGTRATLTTQAAEKIYRTAGPATDIATTLTLEDGAALDWLPQETILFDGADLSRRLDVALADTARLLLWEAVVLGRTARGERFAAGRFVDRWRVRRAGRLIYADGTRLTGGAGLDRSAVLGAARAFGQLVWAAPEAMAALERVRAVGEAAGQRFGTEVGASAFEGCLAVRIVAGDGAGLRRTAVMLLDETRAGALPRVWFC